MASSKKLTFKKGLLRQVFICLRQRGPEPYTGLTHVYVYAVLLFIQGRGEAGELNQRREEGQQGRVEKPEFQSQN
jgi:hypothetical protein